MFEYFEGLSLFVDVVDADHSCRAAHVRPFEAAEVLEALPPVYQFVGALALRLVAFVPVVFGQFGVVAQTDVGNEPLLKG